jgi:hypothetical protein
MILIQQSKLLKSFSFTDLNAVGVLLYPFSLQAPV